MKTTVSGVFFEKHANTGKCLVCKTFSKEIMQAKNIKRCFFFLLAFRSKTWKYKGGYEAAEYCNIGTSPYLSVSNLYNEKANNFKYGTM